MIDTPTCQCSKAKHPLSPLLGLLLYFLLSSDRRALTLPPYFIHAHRANGLANHDVRLNNAVMLAPIIGVKCIRLVG